MFYQERMAFAGVIAYYKNRNNSIGFIIFDDGTSVMLPKCLSVHGHPTYNNVTMRVHQKINDMTRTDPYSFRSSESFRTVYKKGIKSLKEYDNLELNGPRRKCKEITIPVPAKLIKIYKRPHELFKVLRGHKWNKSLFNKAVEESIDQFLKDYDAGLYGDQYVKEDGTFGCLKS